MSNVFKLVRIILNSETFRKSWLIELQHKLRSLVCYSQVNLADLMAVTDYEDVEAEEESARKDSENGSKSLLEEDGIVLLLNLKRGLKYFMK